MICATAWHWPDSQSPAAFDLLQQTFLHGQAGKVRVDDSKKVFVASKKNSAQVISVPDVIVRASARWAAQPHPLAETRAWLQAILPLDWRSALKEPWLFTSRYTGDSEYGSDAADSDDQALIQHWASGGIQYLGCMVRLITPSAFNQAIQRGLNKADLLTESTCQLVAQAIERWAIQDDTITVISDRHGGRTYYAAPLQQLFSASVPMIISETAQDSRYRLTYCGPTNRERILDWSFRVGGDSFAPVSFASIIAKWIREYSMAGLNDFILGQLPSGHALRPTAGYPEDATRFIREVQSAGGQQIFQQHCFIRER